MKFGISLSNPSRTHSLSCSLWITSVPARSLPVSLFPFSYLSVISFPPSHFCSVTLFFQFVLVFSCPSLLFSCLLSVVFFSRFHDIFFFYLLYLLLYYFLHLSFPFHPSLCIYICFSFILVSFILQFPSFLFNFLTSFFLSFLSTYTPYSCSPLLNTYPNK